MSGIKDDIFTRSRARHFAAQRETTPTAVHVAAFLIPYIIAYLVHLPGTRMLRMALYPFSLLAGAWTVLTLSCLPDDAVRTSQAVMLLSLGVATRYSFASSPPVHHPLPHQPLWTGLRQTTAFKAFDLLYNEFRHVNMVPNPPLQTSKRTYFRSMLHHLGFMYLHLLGIDLCTYPAHRIAPDTFGSPLPVRGDFHAWCAELANVWGVPTVLVRYYWTITLAMITYQGMCCVFHMSAVVGIGSGLYIDEEYPKFAYKPWMSTSLNEFWSKRWQQTVRDLLLLVSAPFSHLPRPVHVLAAFMMSAAFHLTLYYPVDRLFVPIPYLIFFGGSGIGCILERQFYRSTGRRVGGWWGRIWTYTCILLLCGPLVDHEWSTGWAGAMRGELAKNPKMSPVEWGVYALGLGDRPY